MKTFLYFFLIFSSVVLFGLTATRLRYTTHLPDGDPLNSGVNFYDPIVAELCASALITFFLSVFYTIAMVRRSEKKRFTRIWFESILLVIVFVMLLVGAAIATSIWPNLHFCRQFKQCRQLTAMVAFAWITFITVMFLLFSNIVYALRFRAWSAHIHGRRWRRRADANEYVSSGAIANDERPVSEVQREP